MHNRCWYESVHKSLTAHSHLQSVIDDQSVSTASNAHNEPSTINSCLDAFTAVESMGADNMVVCEKCKRKTTHSYKVDIYSVPSVLVRT